MKARDLAIICTHPLPLPVQPHLLQLSLLPTLTGLPLLLLDSARHAKHKHPRHTPALESCHGVCLCLECSSSRYLHGSLPHFLQSLLNETYLDQHILTIICNPPLSLCMLHPLSLIWFTYFPNRTYHLPIAAVRIIITVQICAINTYKHFYPKCIIWIANLLKWIAYAGNRT